MREEMHSDIDLILWARAYRKPVTCSSGMCTALVIKYTHTVLYTIWSYTTVCSIFKAKNKITLGGRV